MMTREECETTLLAHLPWIQRTMIAACRRGGGAAGGGGVDADDFVSWATLQLIEDDYAVLRRFRGDSAVRTYLTAVIAMLHREYRVRCWGRWRPSAAARRRGPVAVRLETLVHRDRLPLRQAMHLLRTHGETTLGERELVDLYGALPRRGVALPRELARLTIDAVEGAGADVLVAAAEVDGERRRLAETLARALATLSPDDQELLRMHFWDGLTVAEAARRLGVPQKPLYRRIERALVTLRRRLQADGVSRGAVAALGDQEAA
jgi:RNA polymerase sigma factor (sigma-70 family)